MNGMLHDRSANGTTGRLALALAYAIMIEDTAAREAVGHLAVLVAAFFHVFPEGDHLGAEFGTAGGSAVAFGGVAEEEEATLLL
mmetsp:Transcript_41838/g.76480  ORF Transcript_41838/g.76480 Transcript_41838/m.76480 type:complete len:84 (-) Transcript_41838:1956-2207(-)